MTLKKFLDSRFPGLALEPPLFYSWDAAIRFELGVNESSVSIHDNPLYLPGVYSRAIALFETVHEPVDELYLVADIPASSSRKVFAKYVKERAVLRRLRYEGCVVSDDEDYAVNRFSLLCHRSDIRYVALLKAICNQDMGIQPAVHTAVYFVNRTKGTIFYVYDDRGGDLLGTDVRTIRPVYEAFSDWILDYDRAEIDKVFR
ncbi:DUF3885 domain-containing protein [Sporosarcina sp. PTS2304]|uniref:DUF3885 domain-containing protein n=1 Tax=Sporosarcina sp. PTS2304 TaxID=2283194 RepID=UPI000E0D2192|nr:DUF3885 domain-containing protein [Sporosarcina sp. PTS2304]AXH99794.1 DUF3885 domain-containing protein [Sporosarcina sp. PTS2304]